MTFITTAAQQPEHTTDAPGQSGGQSPVRRTPVIAGIDPSRRCAFTAGETVTPIVNGADVADAYAMWLHEAVPGASPPRHIHHREDEIFHVLEGRLLIECDGQTFEAGPGDTAVLPKGLPHTWRVTSAITAKLLMTIVPGGLDRIFPQAASIGTGGDGMLKLMELGKEFGVEVVGPPLEMSA